MGYYTTHKLTMIDGNTDLVDAFMDEDENAGYALGGHGGWGQSCKWSSHEQDLREFSKKHPEALFELSGEGEDNGDLWKEYYMNGRMQRCEAKIVYPEYDYSKLK